MTHETCIAMLLRTRASGPVPDTRQAALEHVANCSDCWAVLATLHELALGAPPPDMDRMAALYGCGPIQDQLYLATGTSAPELRRQEPQLAVHLAWCLACRDRLAELLAVEQEFGTPAVVPVTRWRETAARAGETVREVAERLVAQVGRAAAVFTEVPAGFLVAPAPAGAGALRGDVAPRAGGGMPALGQEVQFALADSGLWAELRLEPQGERLVGIALRVSSLGAPDLSVQLRELRDERAELIARHTVRGPTPVLVKGIRPGRYVLELHERERTLRFKLRFDVEPAT